MTTVDTTANLAALARTLRQTDFPRQLGLEVTAHCNLRCAMCHHDTMQRPKGRMSIDLFRKCADEVAATAPRTEVWLSFNGEPLLAPDLLLDMVAYGKSVGLTSVNLNTNGMCLDEALDERLLGSGLDVVVFGIDGLSRDTYERVRRGGNRDRVYANVERFLAARQDRATGPEILVQFIEMDENAHEREAFAQHWTDRGALVKVRRKLSWGGRIATPLAVPPEERVACSWAVNLLHVFWDGTVPRCCGDTEGADAVGNAALEPLSVLWGRLAPNRDAHLSGRFDLLPPRCDTCQDWMVGTADKVRPSRGVFAR